MTADVEGRWLWWLWWWYVLGHAGIGGTLALTEAAVAADAAGEVQLTRARARVHRHGLLDDEAIGDELADGLAGVGVGDLRHLVGVEPDLALAAAQHGRRQPLLGPQVNPTAGRETSQHSDLKRFMIAATAVVVRGAWES